MPQAENPQAFPASAFITEPNRTEVFVRPGMTLRDYFAAKVLPELMRENFEVESGDFKSLLRGVTKEAYLWADAMLEARQR